MKKSLLLAAALTALMTAACGGGGDDGGNGGGGGGGAGTGAMAATFSTELAKIKECVQTEASGGAACGINFLTDPVTRMCSDVRTGKTSVEFPSADLSKFTPTCDEWKTFLGLGASEKITTLDKMIGTVDALK